MTELGKVDREFFDESIYPHLGSDRDDISVKPQHGVDFGVIDVGEHAIAMATDPVFIMPSLGFERAAWFTFHILIADVAVSGLPPSHLSVDFNLPPEITNDEFATIWRTFDREAVNLDVGIVTGHTARYAGCNYPMVGGATSIAVGDPEALIVPTGAQVGNRVLITKGPAIEATGLLAIQFASLLDELDPEILTAAQDRFYDMSPVNDAMVAADIGGVTAMHDATEGGVYGGLHELARNADVKLEIVRDRIPIMDGVLETCNSFDIDPWQSISEGTLLMTVQPGVVDSILDALDDHGIPAADIGSVERGSGVYFDGKPVTPPERDPFWAAFESGLERMEGAE